MTDFEWDDAKDIANLKKHGVTFSEAQHAFLDRQRVIARDITHSLTEQRYYCFGSDKEGNGILTVRFTIRKGRVRIIGAGYWRKGKQVYEKEN